MRLEGHQGRHQPRRTRVGDDPPEQRLVAAMDAVEIADYKVARSRTTAGPFIRRGGARPCALPPLQSPRCEMSSA
jgi:hypothetical protein